MHVGVFRVVTSVNICGIMVNTLAWNVKDVGLIPTPDIKVPIFRDPPYWLQ